MFEFDATEPFGRPSRREMMTRTMAWSLGAMATMGDSHAFGKSPLAAVPLKLGLVTYQWGKDLSLVDLLDVCKQTKYAGVELRSTHRHGIEPSMNTAQRSEAKKRFADSPVALVGLGSACEYHAVSPSVVEKNIDETKAFIDLSAELGGSNDVSSHLFDCALLLPTILMRQSFCCDLDCCPL
jgi:hypothetical protein